MSMNANDFVRPVELPWTANEEDEKRYRRILAVLLILFLITAVVVITITLPELTRQEERQIQAQVTKVIEKKKEKPKPKPKPPKVEQKKKKPKPVKPQKDKKKAAKTKAKKRFSQVSNELSGMKSSLNLASISASKKISSGGRIGLKGTRAIITSKNTGGSGGIVTANVSRGVGGGGLAGRVTTRVYSDSADGGTGLGGNGAGKGGGDGGSAGGRNIEQLRRVFDRNKGKLTRIYLREVKKDPTLEGTVVLNLVIEPSGAVSKCKVVSSELKNKKLENKITARCKMFDFGAENVKTTKVNFPVSFLPY